MALSASGSHSDDGDQRLRAVGPATPSRSAPRATASRGQADDIDRHRSPSKHAGTKKEIPSASGIHDKASSSR